MWANMTPKDKIKRPTPPSTVNGQAALSFWRTTALMVLSAMLSGSVTGAAVLYNFNEKFHTLDMTVSRNATTMSAKMSAIETKIDDIQKTLKG